MKKTLFLTLLFLVQLLQAQNTLTITSTYPGRNYVINDISTGIGVIAEEVTDLSLRIIDTNDRSSTLYQFTSLNDITVNGVNPIDIEDAVYMINQVTNIVSFDQDYYVQVAKGLIPGKFLVTKFGRNGSVGTSLTHVSISGFYQTPTSTQTLEIVSSNAADNPAGIGGHKVIIEGLDANFDVQLDTVTLNGITPVTLNKQFIRVYRGRVYESGSYVTTAISSHVGQITLRGVGVGVTWFMIDTVEEAVTGFGIGQTQLGSYTVPKGYTAYLLSKTFSVEANKPASVYFFKRENADDVTPPYSGVMTLFEQNDGVESPFTMQVNAPIAIIKGPAEVGFFAKVPSTTASVSVEFQMLIERD